MDKKVEFYLNSGQLFYFAFLNTCEQERTSRGQVTVTLPHWQWQTSVFNGSNENKS